MRLDQCKSLLTTCYVVLILTASQNVSATTLCVNHAGTGGCYSKIQTAVNNAASGDVINVAPGAYKEDVVIGMPLSLIGAGAGLSVIDATGLANGIYLDGFDHPGLNSVTVARFSVKNAMFEAILVVSATNVTIRNNTLTDNDKFGPIFNPAGGACAGQPAFETDESGDCGGALHLIGTLSSVVTHNTMTGNADGILLSDETGLTGGNLISHNVVKDNPLDCGIVLASHPPVGSTPPHYAQHFGIVSNTVTENVSENNGVKVGGAGVGLFSDGNGPGIVSANVVIHNTLIGNGIGGVSLHSHVGPAFGAPADVMDGNMILENYIAGNLADTDDTATPGRVGININSGGGGSPIWGTVISQNDIRDEDVDVAVNTPGVVEVHLNDLRGDKIGVANVCAFDKASCTGGIDATQNYWGCAAGPGGKGCSTASGTSLTFWPWVSTSVADDDDSGAGDLD